MTIPLSLLLGSGGYLGEGDNGEPQTCMDIGVDTLSKTINGAWLPALFPSESYILQIEQKKCLDASACDFDIQESGAFSGYNVVSKACGAHLKKDSFRPDEYSCELYQINLVEDKNDESQQELVAVLTYNTYYDGYDNNVCPGKPTFNEEEFRNDPNTQGMAQFILQANDLTNSFNTTAWECLIA